MSSDNTCKYLVENHPASFVRWLLNIESQNIEILKTELIAEPIEVDALVLLQIATTILHLEFQTVPYSDPPIPLRMLEYKARLSRKYRCPVEQVVIFLRSINSDLVFHDRYQDDNTLHRYRVIRLWEQDPAPLLAIPDLLPLAVLARSDNPNTLLEQVAQRVAMIEEREQRKNISACISILAGLRFQENLIRRLFREDIMRESVIYQEILEEGLQKGLQTGLQTGRQQGELAMIRRLITRKFGVLSIEIDEQIQKLEIAQLEDLGEALLDFTTLADLETWLQAHQRS